MKLLHRIVVAPTIHRFEDKRDQYILRLQRVELLLVKAQEKYIDSDWTYILSQVSRATRSARHDIEQLHNKQLIINFYVLTWLGVWSVFMIAVGFLIGSLL